MIDLNPEGVPAGTEAPKQYWSGEWIEYGVYWPEHVYAGELVEAWVEPVGTEYSKYYVKRALPRGSNPGYGGYWPGHGVLVSRRVTQTVWSEASPEELES